MTSPTPTQPDHPRPEGPERGRPRPAGDLDAKLEAEIEAALGDMTLQDMLEVAEEAHPRSGGQTQMKTGTIVRIHKGDVFVEFGPKSVGVCQRSQFDNPPTVGERMPFVVDRYDAREGLLILSRQGAVTKAVWASLAKGQIVQAQCRGVNKGGLEMEVANHLAFMPAGQVDLRHVEDLSCFVGQKMPCEIVELDRARGRIILSRRRTLETERQAQREKLLAELAEDQQRPAVIRSIQPYGAFADLGGIDGLIHISDICHERIKHPAERLSEGEEVQVKILKIDRTQDPPRIGLGLKQCQADPFLSGAARIAEGDTVTGKVTRIMAYGAFVEITPGVEGLVHISQLSAQRITRVAQVVKLHEVITVKVLDIDAGRRRISLSLRAAQKADPEALRPDDPAIKKLKAKFSGDLKGGIG